MLSKTLKRLRENCGFTQQQVADALNIDRSTYTYYETAKTTPDINTIIKLSKIFHVTYNDILDDEKPLSKVKDYTSELHSGKSVGSIYELTKREKQLVIFFRLLTEEGKAQLIRDAEDMVKDLEE